jgi:H+/Cl- antiporter ClcA
LAGILLAVPRAFSHATTTSNVFHVYQTVRPVPSETVPVALASCVALASGAPLGPEQALGMVAASLSAIQLKWNHQTTTTTIHQQQVCLNNALGASMAAVMPGLWGGILPAMLHHELSVAGRPNNPQDVQEGLSLLAASSFLVALLVRTVLPSVTLLGPLTPTAHDFYLWHVPAGIVLGCIGGIVGCCILLVFALASLIRRRMTCYMGRCGVPQWICMILFTTAAGAIHGLLAVGCPYSATGGLQFMKASWEAAHQHENVLTWDQYSLTAITRILGLGISLGFGLIGGTIIPTLTIGLCVGFTAARLIPFLPFELTVPCSVAAVVVSLCPIPLTAVVATILIFGCTAEHTTPIFFAAVMAWTVTGGLGIVRTVAERWLGDTRSNSPLDGIVSDTGPLRSSTDNDYIRSIRETIFGEG